MVAQTPTEIQQLPADAQRRIRQTCSYFTAYADIEKASTRRRRRQADQELAERNGCPGPYDHLNAAINTWLQAQQQVSQSAFDFDALPPAPAPAAPSTLATTLHIQTSASPALLPHHRAEWTEKSGIDPELTDLAIVSIKGDIVFDKLRPYPAGLDISKERWKLRDVCNGGAWLCTGLDLDGYGYFQKENFWCCIKPDQPRRVPDSKGGFKPLKYEHPKGVETQPFYLPFPRHVGEAIARRYRCLTAYAAWENEAERTPTQRWHWFLRTHPVPVVITEGAKKAAALLTAGYLGIGLAGIWNGTARSKSKSIHRLRSSLRLHLTFTPKVTIAFDYSEKEQGTIDVRHATERLAAAIQRDTKGTEVFIAELPGPQKGIDDVLVECGATAVEDIIRPALAFHRWQVRNRQKALLHRIQHPIDLDGGRPVRVINQRYMTADDIPTDARLLAIRMPMETGKTASIVNYVSRTGIAPFPVLHRRGLAGNTAQRFHRPYQSEGRLIYPWRSGDQREIPTPPTNLDYNGRLRFGVEIEALREADENGKIVVLDSSHADGSSHISPDACRGALLFLDEWDESCWHLLNGATEIQAHRAEVVANFTACLKAAKQVIVASAHLHEAAIAYLEQLLGVTAHVLTNEFKPAKGRTAFLFSDQKAWLQTIADHITNGESIYVAVTSQKSTSVYSAANLAAYISANFDVPSSDILVVDSETTRTAEHPARGAVTNPGEMLRYRIVIATPCIETGVSIDDVNGHFDAVFSYSTGCTSPQAAVQTIGRVRSSVNRYVCVSPNGRTVFGGATDPDDVWAINNKAAMTTRDALFRAGIADISQPIDDSHTRAWATLVADYNAFAKDFGFAVQQLLIDEGYTVLEASTADEDAAAANRDLLKEAGAELTATQCREVALSTPTSQDEIEQLERKPELTIREQRELEHGRVARDFGVETADDAMVLAHRRRAFPALRTELLLEELSRMNGTSELLRQLDGLSAMKKRFLNSGTFLPDVNRAFQSPRMALLHDIGAINLMRRRGLFTPADDDMAAIVDAMKRRRSECKLHLGIDPFSVSPRTVLKELAERCGYELRSDGSRIVINGKQVRPCFLADAFPGIDRDEIKRHIADTIAARWQQACDDVADADPEDVPAPVAAVVSFQQNYDHFIGDPLEAPMPQPPP